MTDAIDKILEDPAAASLDRVLSTAPSLIDNEDLMRVIQKLRQNRVLFMQAEQGGKPDAEAKVQEADQAQD